MKILPNKSGVLCFCWFLFCFYSIEDVADSVPKNGGGGVMENGWKNEVGGIMEKGWKNVAVGVTEGERME